MLQILEKRGEIKEAHKRLKATLTAVLPSRGIRNIGYPGGNENHEVFAAGENELYCAFSPPRTDVPIARYWNSFGSFRPDAPSQQIIVEINMPVEGEDGRVAGFFAQDSNTGEIYLMHDGGIGGGREGVGKAAFLGFVSDPLYLAHSEKRTRSAMMIGNLNDHSLPALIWRFAQKVEQFKENREELAAGPPQTPPPAKDFVSEFSGRRKGKRKSEFDYFTYHGMVVDALKEQIDAQLKSGQTASRDILVDLFVTENGRRTEVFEVKTSADRQSFYTAIGQLMTHGREAEGRRVLVIPKEPALPVDCLEATRDIGIEVRHFTIAGEGARAKIILL